MKHPVHFIILSTLMLLLPTAIIGCQDPQAATPNNGVAEQPVSEQSREEKAITAKDELFKRLSGRLAEVMQSDGPIAAIEVCSREASEIAKTVGDEHGVTIGRTALKLRNSANAPPDWVQPLIIKPKDEPQFIELANGHTGALLPIKLKAKCVTCHGPADEIADEVKTQIAKLYPTDSATGYKEGDLRGWFWVDVP